MKNRVFLLVAASLVLSLIGCKHNPSDVGQDGEGLIVDAVVGDATKYDGGVSFVVGDKISLYATLTGTALTNTGNFIDNSEYVRGDQYFAKTGGTDAYPASGGIDIFAFYPQNGITINAGGVDSHFDCNADQTSAAKYVANDFLMAKKGNQAPSRLPVMLSFEHMMTKLVVSAKTGPDFTAGEKVANIVIKGVTGATIDVNTKVVTARSAQTLVDITATMVTDPGDPDKMVATVILPPQSYPIGTVAVQITLSNGKKYDYAFKTAAFELKQGCVSTLDLFVTQGSADVIPISATITDWTPATLADNVTIIESLKTGFSGTIDVAKAYTSADVTVKVNGETKNTTFNVPVTVDGTKLYFEFRGANNVPAGFPYKVLSVTLNGATPLTLTVAGSADVTTEATVKAFTIAGNVITFS